MGTMTTEEQEDLRQQTAAIISSDANPQEKFEQFMSLMERNGVKITDPSGRDGEPLPSSPQAGQRR
ncbi:hypothetical protein ACFL0U_01685 [Pseudomonadota bacterium]